MASQLTHPAEQIESIDASRFECIDGRLIERPLPTVKHSSLQRDLTFLVHPQAKQRGMDSGPELSIDKTPGSRSDWMTPDYAVSMPGGYQQNQNGHAVPPVYLLIEILSPDQHMTEMERKGQRYLDWGAHHVWLIDPIRNTAVVMHRAVEPKHVGLDGQLEADTDFALPLKQLLS